MRVAAMLATCCCPISSLGEAPVAATLTPRQRRQVASRWNAEPVPFFLGVDHESALLLAAADAGLAAATSDIPALVAAVRTATEEKPWLWLRARLNLILVDLNLGRLRAAAGNASALRKELHAGMSGQPVPAWTAASTAEHEAAVQGTRDLLPTVMQAELYLWAELRADEEHDGDVVRLAMGIGRTVASDTAGAYAALPLLPLRAAQMLQMVAATDRSSSSQLDADISALWRAAAGGVLGTGDVMKLALVSTSGRPYQRAVRASGGPTAEAAARTDYSALEARSAWQAHAGDGGWLHHQHEPTGSADTESRCDIDRRSDLTTTELLDEYVKEGRPVLLRSLLDGWPVRRWERRSVLSRLGNHSVLVRSSGFIAAARSTGGFRSRDAAAGGTSMKLRDFVTAMRAHTAAAGQEEEEEQATDAGYVFTEDSLLAAGEDYAHPSLFFTDQSGSDAETEAGADSVLPWTPSEREHKAIFCLGQRGSGVGFHHHSNALNALVYGRKRWFLSPLHTTHGPYGGPVADYVGLLRGGELPSRPIECVQEAGEVLFVPSGWEHATVNEAESIGLAMEMGDSPEQSLAVLLEDGRKHKGKWKTNKKKKKKTNSKKNKKERRKTGG